jgi:hypothetical protein
MARSEGTPVLGGPAARSQIARLPSDFNPGKQAHEKQDAARPQVRKKYLAFIRHLIRRWRVASSTNLNPTVFLVAGEFCFQNC